MTATVKQDIENASDPAPESLTTRAVLSLIGRLLQQTVEYGLGFIATPLLLVALGKELYGVWALILQTIGYLAISDLRPMATLKYTLGVRQHHDDVDYKKRQIGVSLILWAFTFPLFSLLGVVLIIFTPSLVDISVQHVTAVRITLGIMVFATALERLLGLPANILLATNFEYKALGVTALSTFLGGIFGIGAAVLGMGLPGQAIAVLITSIISGGIRLRIVIRNVTWFGVAMPTRPETVSFFKLSGWLFISSLTFVLLTSTHVMITSVLFNPETATVYVVTGLVVAILSSPMLSIIASIEPGIAGLIGQQDWTRVYNVRHEIYIAAVSLITIIGCCALLLNRAFLNLWVGPGIYGGVILTLVLILQMLLSVTYRINAQILDYMTMVRQETLASLLTAVFSIVIGVALAQWLGLVGIVIGSITGYLCLLIFFSRLISAKTGAQKRALNPALIRLISIMFALFSLCIVFSPVPNPTSWPEFIVQGFMTAGTSALILWLFGFGRTERKIIFDRVLHPFAAILTRVIAALRKMISRRTA